MTPSMPEQEIEEFIQRSGWNPDQEIQPREDLEKPEENEDNVIVFSIGKEIRVLDYDYQDYSFKKRGQLVNTLCSHKGNLYESWEDGIIAESQYCKPIGMRDVMFPTMAMWSHNNKIYDAGLYNSIVETVTNKMMGRRDHWGFAITTHKGRLIDGGAYKGIRDTLTGEKLVDTQDTVRGLCSIAGTLYDARFNKEESHKIYESLSDDVIQQRPRIITSLCSMNGRLYDCGQYRMILDTFDNRVIHYASSTIFDMCTHPRAYFVEKGVLPP